MSLSQREKAERFVALHEGPPFVIPNPCDAGTAKVLESLGAEALATTSSGLAFTLGRSDGTVTLEEIVAHVGAVNAATSLPVSVDLENGYAAEAGAAARAVVAAAEAGAVGGSIEDWDRDDERLYEPDAAAERVAAAVEATSGLDHPFVLTARAENHIRGNPDLDDTIARLRAYESAGADVLYAPGLRTVDEIRAVCSAVFRPVNVLIFPGLARDQVFAAGAQRISVGGALTWAGVEAFADAARALLDDGDASGLRGGGRSAEWVARTPAR